LREPSLEPQPNVAAIGDAKTTGFTQGLLMLETLGDILRFASLASLR
jgi:hypothetical protein